MRGPVSNLHKFVTHKWFCNAVTLPILQRSFGDIDIIIFFLICFHVILICPQIRTKCYLLGSSIYHETIIELSQSHWAQFAICNKSTNNFSCFRLGNLKSCCEQNFANFWTYFNSFFGYRTVVEQVILNGFSVIGSAFSIITNALLFRLVVTRWTSKENNSWLCRFTFAQDERTLLLDVSRNKVWEASYQKEYVTCYTQYQWRPCGGQFCAVASRPYGFSSSKSRTFLHNCDTFKVDQLLMFFYVLNFSFQWKIKKKWTF